MGERIWARGFFVNGVGRDEDAIQDYVRNQEKEDERLERLNLWRYAAFGSATNPTVLSCSKTKDSGFAGRPCWGGHRNRLAVAPWGGRP